VNPQSGQVNIASESQLEVEKIRPQSQLTCLCISLNILAQNAFDLCFLESGTSYIVGLSLSGSNLHFPVVHQAQCAPCELLTHPRHGFLRTDNPVFILFFDDALYFYELRFYAKRYGDNYIVICLESYVDAIAIFLDGYAFDSLQSIFSALAFFK
jgi:hypothetical protein